MKIKNLVLSAAALAISGLAVHSSAWADGRGFTVEDMVKMERVVAPAVSPDGKLVVYAQRSVDLDKNRGRWDLWMVNLGDASPTPKKLTNVSNNNEGNNSGAQWSAKGDAIFFVSSRSGSGQVWRIVISVG